jgi:hypothetical protein
VQLLPSPAPLAHTSPPITAAGVQLRLRPGDRPRWCDASPWQESFSAWRDAARAVGLPVYVAVVCLLEYDLALEDLAPWITQPEECLGDAAQLDGAVPRINGEADMRAWLAVLAGPGHLEDDGLPEIALPARLTARPTVNQRWGERLKPCRLEDALACERAAAQQGLTLEAWALRAALAAPRGR